MASKAKRTAKRLSGWVLTLIGSEHTGLPNRINISIGGNIGEASDPRIRVSNLRGKFPQDDADSFYVLVEDGATVVRGTPCSFTAEELSAISAWIALNKAVLLEFWFSDDMDSSDALASLQPLT